MRFRSNDGFKLPQLDSAANYRELERQHIDGVSGTEDDDPGVSLGRGQFTPQNQEEIMSSAAGHIRRMTGFQRASDIRHDVGDARARTRARDQAIVDDPKATQMEKFQAASRLRHDV